MIRRSLYTAVLGVLAGCTSVTAPVDDGSAPPPPEAARALTPEEQTLAAMLERARNARLAGELAEAESTLEAALRIAPADARLWLELAEVQFASGEFDSAQTLAERAVSLAGGDTSVVEAARRLSAQMGQ